MSLYHEFLYLANKLVYFDKKKKKIKDTSRNSVYAIVNLYF